MDFVFDQGEQRLVITLRNGNLGVSRMDLDAAVLRMIGITPDLFHGLLGVMEIDHHETVEPRLVCDVRKEVPIPFPEIITERFRRHQHGLLDIVAIHDFERVFHRVQTDRMMPAAVVDMNVDLFHLTSLSMLPLSTAALSSAERRDLVTIS